MNTLNTIKYQNQSYNRAGKGLDINEFRYMCPNNGVYISAFFARIVDANPHWAVARVPGNPSLNRVVIPHNAVLEGACGLRVGDEIMLSNLDFSGSNGPRATSCWMVKLVTGENAVPTPQPVRTPTAEVRRAAPPINGRKRGWINSVNERGFGFILDNQGVSYFVHSSALRGVPMQVGVQCSFIPAANERGATAIDVQPV